MYYEVNQEFSDLGFGFRKMSSAQKVALFVFEVKLEMVIKYPLIVRLKLLFVFENKQSLNSVLGGSIFDMQFSFVRDSHLCQLCHVTINILHMKG